MYLFERVTCLFLLHFSHWIVPNDINLFLVLKMITVLRIASALIQWECVLILEVKSIRLNRSKPYLIVCCKHAMVWDINK